MTALFIQNMAPIMFAALVFFLLLGYPVAFSLAANGLIFGLVGIWLNLFTPDFLQALPERVYGVMSNDTLLAIPFFTFMGLVLERSGMAEDLLDTIGQLFGTVRGGLAYAVIFVGALLAATTGVVAASVISMGLISLPIMLRYGYDRRVASGVIAASGTLAQIIPPSLVLIVMADQLGRSVGDMYEGAFLPGLTLAALYAVFVFITTILFPNYVPGLPADAVGFREDNGARGLMSLAVLTAASTAVAILAMRGSDTHGADYVVLTMFIGIVFAFAVSIVNWLCDKLFGFRFLSRLGQQVTFVMVPPLFLIFLVLGTIFIGVATPTEGGAMGATGALALGALKRRLSWDLVRQAAESTAKLSAFVVFILVGARVFSLTFYGVDGHRWVESFLVSLPGGPVGFLVFVNLFVFVLAFFLDFFEIAFIVIPLLGPAAEHLRPRFRQTHRAGHHRADLLGRRPLCRHPGDHGRARHRLPGPGDALQGAGLAGRSLQGAHRHPGARHSAAARFRSAAAEPVRLGATAFLDGPDTLVGFMRKVHAGGLQRSDPTSHPGGRRMKRRDFLKAGGAGLASTAVSPRPPSPNPCPRSNGG